LQPRTKSKGKMLSSLRSGGALRPILKNQNVCVLSVANISMPWDRSVIANKAPAKGDHVSVPSGNVAPCEGLPFGATKKDAMIDWDTKKSSWPYPGPAVPASMDIPGIGYPKYLKDIPDQTPGIADGYSPMGHKILDRQEHMDTWNYVNSVYFGPERDKVNFPTPAVPMTSPETRIGIFPATWFEAFHNTTGVSGGYVFGFGFFTWLHSMEYNTIDNYFWQIPSFWGAIYFLHCHPSVGPKAKVWLHENWVQKWKNLEWDRPLGRLRSSAEKDISKLKRLIEECETQTYIKQAKEEGVALQLESAYRERLQNAFTEVKKRLDYESQKVTVRSRFEQDHMVNWIVNNVTKSITPQQEKDSIKNCMETLKSMSATQKVSVA